MISWHFTLGRRVGGFWRSSRVFREVHYYRSGGIDAGVGAIGGSVGEIGFLGAESDGVLGENVGMGGLDGGGMHAGGGLNGLGGGDAFPLQNMDDPPAEEVLDGGGSESESGSGDDANVYGNLPPLEDDADENNDDDEEEPIHDENDPPPSESEPGREQDRFLTRQNLAQSLGLSEPQPNPQTSDDFNIFGLAASAVGLFLSVLIFAVVVVNKRATNAQ